MLLATLAPLADCLCVPAGLGEYAAIEIVFELALLAAVVASDAIDHVLVANTTFVEDRSDLLLNDLLV
jgi:hypothetical protein